MKLQKNETFSLNNFEGSIDFLLYLIQKEEIQINDISLHEITQQILLKFNEWKNSHIDQGSEWIGHTAYLHWLKSKSLCPTQEIAEEPPLQEEGDPNFDIIYHLIDYCRFKDAAKELSQRHEQQSACFFRGGNAPEAKRPMGIDHISLEELSVLFKDMMIRANLSKPKIYEENWKVSDKIQTIQTLIQQFSSFFMDILFPLSGSRQEWIVAFLAILELIKIGEIAVGKDPQTNAIIVFAKHEVRQ